ncbi:MAG: carboxyvinyl-carboxyphosphonate phosphorylmutase, partial [Desulfobacteraceae bacterium]|nr:carboxyvinyl-carboxyphosphonate phosphorylmutase [Desulfobacteraceae bacterium]
MKKTTLLKNYILDEQILVMPGAHDVLCARIIEKAGFKALTMGGYSASASLLGQPDVSLLSMTEMADSYRRVTNSVDIPVFVDGDTGFGG